MKAKIQIGGNEEVTIRHGVLLVEECRDFIVNVEDMENKWCRGYSVTSTNWFRVEVKRIDGWEVIAQTIIGNDQHVMFTRVRRNEKGDIVRKEYLTRRKKWRVYPQGYKALKDALELPLFVMEAQTRLASAA